jgi:hypothetical protein
VVSRFSFPAKGPKHALQYITPLKIPHPAGHRRRRSTRLDDDCRGASDHGIVSNSNSSAGGSYVGAFCKGEMASGSSASPAAHENTSSFEQHQDWAAERSPMEHAQPGRQRARQRGKETEKDNRNASGITASSMSSEAAALLQALQAAARQREIARGVLMSRSTTGPNSPASSTWTPHSEAGAFAAGAFMQRKKRSHSAAKHQMASQDGTPEPTDHAEQALQHCIERKSQPHHSDNSQQNTQSQATPAGGHSPQPSVSVVGPLVPSNMNCRLDQKAAAEQLFQDVLDSGSFSDLAALADDDICSDSITAAAIDSTEEEAHSKKEAEYRLLPGQAVAGLQPESEIAVGAEFAAVMTAACRPLEELNQTSTCLPDMRPSASSLDRSLQPQAMTTTPATAAADGKQQLCCIGIAQHPQQHQDDQHLALNKGRALTPSPVASQPEVTAASAQLEMLGQQVELERMRLEQLLQQQHLMQQQLASPAPSNCASSQQQRQRQWLQAQQPDHHPVSMRRSLSCGELPVGAGNDSAAGTGTGAAAPAAAVVMANNDAAAGTAPVHQALPAGSAAAACSTSHGQTVASPICWASAAVQATADVADAASQVDPDLPQAVPGPDVAAADSATVDVGCQALLLCSAGLPAVGPPGPCRVCPLVQQQLAEMGAKLIQAQQQQQQVMCSLYGVRARVCMCGVCLALLAQPLLCLRWYIAITTLSVLNCP